MYALIQTQCKLCLSTQHYQGVVLTAAVKASSSNILITVFPSLFLGQLNRVQLVNVDGCR